MEADYAGLHLTTGPHPMTLLRGRLTDVWCAGELSQAGDGWRVRVAGQVISRQRPGTAKGICFISLEDETGVANVIVTPALFEAERLRLVSEPFLLVEGRVQKRHNTIHIQAEKFEWLQLEVTTAASHDFG